MTSSINRNTLPKDILSSIAHMADIPSFACTCKQWKSAHETVYRGLKDEYTQSPHLSQFVTQITHKHLAQGQVPTDLQIVQGVYHRVINQVKNIGGGQSLLKETSNYYQNQLSTKRLEELAQWTKEQEALALIELFKQIAIKIPLANTFLASLSYLETIDQASKIHHWMSQNTHWLHRIDIIDLSKKQLKILPSEISLISNLERLCLAENQLQTLPAECGQLTNLKRLDLSHNKLRTIPPEFKQLEGSLRMLLLNDNNLRIIPEYIKTMNLRKLKYDIDHNDILYMMLTAFCAVFLITTYISIQDQWKVSLPNIKPLLSNMAPIVFMLVLILSAIDSK